MSRPFILNKLPEEKAFICPFRALKEYWDAFNIGPVTLTYPGIWFDYRASKMSPLKHATLAKDCVKIMELAGIPMGPSGYSAATLWHAVITWWHSQQIPIEVVMARTGHKSTNLVLKYFDKSLVSHDINDSPWRSNPLNTMDD